ncbi:glucosylceramidase [Granulicella rosea]|uniref:Glucosylceramidase n=1 Tax=Granulicella rosea TaxID=474952 RepID=A0A239EEM9_9BACT|nr:glycoside hydrolase family 30 beta sandwich domain-containing protein [Granulicella rosea]SNS43230.1 glucosylceramidase [Granulicella rosea]
MTLLRRSAPLLLLLALNATSRLAAQTVHVVESTADEKELLVRKTLPLEPGASTAKVRIQIDATMRMQTMDGFGASLTDSSASLIAHLSPEQRDALMHEVFAPDGPLGLTLLRQPIGASDFSAHGDYSYDDPVGAKSDPTLEQFSARADERYLFPLLREAEHLNPRLRVMGMPWSAPAWMKLNHSMRAGSLDDRNVDVYARYLARTVEAYSMQGVPLFALALQNEPMNENPSYPTQAMSPEQEAKLAATLVPMLKAAGRSPLLFGYEHNWNHLEYPEKLLSEAERLKPAGSPDLFAGISFHCYGGNESAQGAFLRSHPNTRLWFTECSAINSSPFAETFLWQAQHLLMGAPKYGARSVMLWNIALDSHGDPHNGGCDQCTGLITFEKHGGETQFKRTAGYYVLAQAAPYVHPGATHIGAVVAGSGSVMAEAYENEDGTDALLLLNLAPAAATIGVDIGAGKESFEYTLPAHALTTLTWGTPLPMVRDGLYRLAIQPAHGERLALEAAPHQSDLLERPLGDGANQLWTIHRLASGRFEIRNVGTAQALAVSSAGRLAALTLTGTQIAPLPLRIAADGLCIALSRTGGCSSAGAEGRLPGDVLLTPIAAAPGILTDK